MCEFLEITKSRDSIAEIMLVLVRGQSTDIFISAMYSVSFG